MDLSQKYIAVICNYELLPERVGGMDYFFWMFNEKCSNAGIKVNWFFPNIANHGDYRTFTIVPANGISLEEHVISHLRHSKIKYSHVFTHFVELCTSFFKDLKKLQPSQIIAVDHNPRPLNGYPLKKRVKKRIKGILYSKYIDTFIGVSNYTNQVILKDFGSFLKHKTITLYNGVITKDIIPKTGERKLVNPRFLVVSHLRFSKGVQDLIKAVSLLPVNLKRNLKVDIFGDGPYKETLLNLINHYELENIFSFKGSQPNIKELYQNYDYMLQPTHMECFSLSILESLAANIPVITTPVGGNVEVVKHGKNGFIFDTKNLNELARLLEAVLKGEKVISANTRKQIEDEFSIDLMVENYMKLLQK